MCVKITLFVWKKKEKFQEFTKSISIVWQIQQKLVDALSKMPNSSPFTKEKC